MEGLIWKLRNLCWGGSVLETPLFQQTAATFIFHSMLFLRLAKGCDWFWLPHGKSTTVWLFASQVTAGRSAQSV